MKERLINLLLPFSWILILISCCFIFAFTSHAESSINVPLPYVVPDYFGLNNVCSIETIEAIYNGYFVPNVQPYYPNTDFTKAVLYYTDPPNPDNEGLVSVFVLPNPVVTTSIPNDTTYENWDLVTGVINVQPTGRIFTMNLKLDLPIERMYRGSNQGDGSVNLFGQHATISNSYGNTTILYPFLMIGIDNLYDSSGNYVIMTNEQQAIPPSAVAPDFSFFQPQFPPMVTGPTIVPSFHNWTPYQWGTYTPPTFDDSSVINAIKSIGEMLGYGFQYVVTNIINSINNIGNNLHTFFEDLIQTLQYYFGLVISNIQNGIQNIYENFKSLIEPITSAISYISQPVSGTVIYDNISGTTLIQIINTIDTALTTFQGTFTGLSEPDSFVIPIHLESLPSSWFGTQTTQYLDLSWINSDMRILIRGFMWAIITYALFITIVDSIANYINGGGDES